MNQVKKLITAIIPKSIIRRARFEYHRATTHRAIRKRLLERSKEPRLIYALTPPSELKNIGDHAQVVAILSWLEMHFAEYEVIEINKSEIAACISEIKKSKKPGDIIVLHSGGNLGDRGIWSEAGRRLIIDNLRDVPIFSLPQTIFFSDTVDGQRQRAITEDIYSRHPTLLIAARDYQSGKLAEELFPKAHVVAMPDFVLSLEPSRWCQRNTENQFAVEGNVGRGVLCCLRNDDESALTAADKDRIEQIIGSKTERYDTTLESPIQPEEREALLRDTLHYFMEFDAVITDRYHGLIFATICQRPTVVLRTVDHKLTSAFDWFRDLPYLRMADSIDDIPRLLSLAIESDRSCSIDWNQLYFAPLAERIRAILREKKA